MMSFLVPLGETHGVMRIMRREIAAARTAPNRRLAPPGHGVEGERCPVATGSLERELVALAWAAGPLRRALARIAGRMVAARGWERLGFARLADYAAERAGISARELRDLARVDRALAGLPALDHAFETGALGWTQLRLLCRVARPQDEAEWLAVAERLTAPALAREVRAVDRCAREASAGASLPEEASERRVGVVVRCSPAVRACWWHTRQVANRVAGRSLSAADFVEAVTAEVLSAVGVAVDPGLELREPAASDDGAERSATADEEVDPARAAVPAARVAPTPPGAPCPPAFVVALARDLDGADAFELDERLRRALRLESRRLSRLAAQLDRAVALGLPRQTGFASLDAYAQERLGMAPSRARALLRIARAAAVCPALHKAFAHGRISWVQAHALVPLLFEPGAARHRSAWVRHAERVSVRRLSEDLEYALATEGFAPPPLTPQPCADDGADPPDLQIGAIARSRAEPARLFFAASPEVAHLFCAALATVQRRLEHLRRRPASPGDALAAMLAHALATWAEEDPRARASYDRRVFERDGWRCTVPGCSAYRNLHGHHIVFRSQGGSDAPTNLTTLCAWHHQRGIHTERTLSCSGEAPHALHFALGLRPDRAPLLAFSPGEVLGCAS
jgi:hypothetical protein